MERAEIVERLRAGIQGEGRNIHERYNIVEATRLLMIKLLEELEGERDEVLNGFEKDERVEELDRVAKQLIERGMELIRDSEYNDGKVRIAGYIKEAYQVLGRRDFEKFLIAIEWNYPKDMKFYDIRENVLRDWVKDLEDLEYGRLKILSISAPPRTGKALSLDSKILTPIGWKEMRNIKEGDYVISADGKKAEVLGVFPQGKKEMYRVTFDDRTSVKCSGDHLWEVQSRDDRRRNKKRVIKTEEMIKNYLVENKTRKNYSIEYVKPVEFENKVGKTDLKSYLLGALIGDGGLSSGGIKFTNADDEILRRIRDELPEGDTLRYTNRYDYRIVKEKDIRNEKGYLIKGKTQEKLEEYGLYGKGSKEKFIPKKYLYSSIENRIELLRGLMDTDGSLSTGSIAEFDTISSQLADDVTELVRSLGGRVTRGEKIGKYKNKNGEIIECNKVYRLYIKMPINPFYLKRKAEKYITREKHIRKNKYIEKIEKIEDEECQCIYVNHPSHLFVTDGYNLTHNTTIGERFFLWCMLRHPSKSCFFVSHTAAMAIKVYNDLVGILEDSKAEITKIFPNGVIMQRNAEQMYIQLRTDMKTGYATAYFRGIDGNMAGVLEASWLLYCDDLIKNIEEAMNPDRLETARTKYGTDIVQRKANKGVRELHIATRWSTGDVISTLEKNHEGDEKAKFLKKPALDENGKSNFMYKGDYALDEEYFLERRNSPMMDEVSFSCIYQQEPIEREGLWLKEESLKYFDGELPEEGCDIVCGACDVAWGGGDYLSMPIAKVYGTSVYIVDVVYNNNTKEITRPIVIGAIENNKVEKIIFEANNGGDEYCDKVKESLSRKIDIRSQKAPANKSKTARIMSVTDEVMGVSPEYQVYFLDKEARKKKPMYEKFMKDLFKYNTASKYIGRQKDDCADSLAILINQVLESRVSQPKAVSKFSRKDLLF